MVRKITLVAFPGFELLDLSGPMAVFCTASWAYGAPYVVNVESASGGAIGSTAGLLIETEKFAGASEIDTLIVVGGPTAPAIGQHHATIELLVAHAGAARRVASVCTGAFLLAAAGLLDRHSATTHWRFATALQSRFSQVRVNGDRIFIKDGNIWTSAGVTAGIDLALALVEEDCGVQIAKAVARDLVVYHRRPGGQSQFSAMLELEPASDRVKIALGFAREHLSEPLTVDRLAEVACISPRQFSRLFLSETGETPARAIERLRVEAARPRVEGGIEPMDRIARDVGFGERERMRRSFVRIHGRTPQAMRRDADHVLPLPPTSTLPASP